MASGSSTCWNRRKTLGALLGSGCLIAFMLLSSMSSLSYGDFATAFNSIRELATTTDVGCALACGVALAMGAIERKGATPHRAAVGATIAVCGVGLCLSAFLRAGYLAGSGETALLVGDACVGFFFTLSCLTWWHVFAALDEVAATRRLAQSFLVGLALFMCLAAMPAEAAMPLMAIGLPGVSCALCAVLACGPDGDAGSGAHTDGQSAGAGAGEASPRRVLIAEIAATISVSSLLTGLLLNIVPIALNTEDSFNSLSLPSGGAAVLLAVLAVCLLLVTSRSKSIPLAGMYIIGFTVLAFGYLTFPFLPSGGVSLALLAVGQFVVMAFIVVLVMRFHGGEARSWSETSVFAFGAAATCAGELVADVIATIVVDSPSYIYDEFQTRAVITFIALAILIVFALVALPKVEVAVTSASADKRTADVSAPSSHEKALEEFAAAHGLSPRETEILLLIAAGRDVPYIENKLTLAKSTVKTP